MSELGGLWGIATILGPILLGAAMVYGVLMYRKRGRRHQKSDRTDDTRAVPQGRRARADDRELT